MFLGASELKFIGKIHWKVIGLTVDFMINLLLGTFL